MIFVKIFDLIITTPITWLVEWILSGIPNAVVAIVLFTLITKVILFPLSLWSQMQAVKLAKMKPKLDDIKAYYSHDWRLLLKEQRKLYKEEKYKAIVSLLPLILQIPIILGVIRAMDNLLILNTAPSNAWLPALSAASAFLLCYVQNLCNVLAKGLKFFSKWGLAIFLTAFSLYFTIVSSEGFGVYWTAGNLLGIGVQLICNLIYNPKKYITYEVLPPPKTDRALKKRQKEREKIDVPRFNKTKKHLVFYSEASGFYKYFKGMIGYILDHSKLHVHYLTSDINDQVFAIDHPQFHAYYCGPKALIVTLMKLDCKVCVLSMPDLGVYQHKRSIVNKNIEYIYVDHGFSSLSFVTRKHAIDYFDTLFCYGTCYNEEARAMEAFYGSKEKTLVNTGYALYKTLKDNDQPVENEQKTIIIAPSWQKDNIMDSCIDALMQQLAKTDYKVILRPHPEFIKRFPHKISRLKKMYANELQLDFSTPVTNADILISDWSSVAWEFSYATNRPALFIDTPMKIMNPDWDKYGTTPIEIALRGRIGVTVAPDELDTIGEKLALLKEIENPRAVIDELMYDNADADAISGNYIIGAVKRAANQQN